MQQDRIRIHVHVHPNARRNALVAYEADTLKIKLAAPPEKGKANKALVGFLSRVLGISKSAITIERGETGRRKILNIAGLDLSEFRQRIDGWRNS